METNITENIFLPWYKVWIEALTRPSVAVYENFLKDSHATFQRAYVWLIISGIVFGFIAALTEPHLLGFWMSAVVMITCDTLVPSLVVVVSITVIAGLIQLLAQGMGGIGTYSKLIYALAAFNAPMTMISALVLLTPYYGLWIYAAISIYQIALSAIAVKAVHQFEWRKTMVAILPIIVLAVLLFIGLLLLAKL